MYKVGLIGALGVKNIPNGGQEIKTAVIASEIALRVGNDVFMKINTQGKFFHIKLPFILLSLLVLCKNIVLLPGQNGLKIFGPFFALFNIFFRRKIHYVVVGGWLPDFIEQHQRLFKFIKKFDGVYVETSIMKNRLNKIGLQNVFVMPNFKNLTVLRKEQLKETDCPPFKFCTFSRLTKDKGIEIAVDAIKTVNRKLGNVCELDIYGRIEESNTKWFNSLMDNFPYFINYKGWIEYDKSVDVLKDYYALLFPTYYEGEGFAGTLLDAFAAGVPVIASDWHYNAELVENGVTGLICKVRDTNDLAEKILFAIEHKKEWSRYKENCIEKANDFIPSNVIKTLLSRFG